MHIYIIYMSVMNSDPVIRGTVVPTESDSDEIFCLQLLSKILPRIERTSADRINKQVIY